MRTDDRLWLRSPCRWPAERDPLNRRLISRAGSNATGDTIPEKIGEVTSRLLCAAEGHAAVVARANECEEAGQGRGLSSRPGS